MISYSRIHDIVVRNMPQHEIERFEDGEQPNRIDNIIREFQELLDKAYDAGYENGKNVSESGTENWIE